MQQYKSKMFESNAIMKSLNLNTCMTQTKWGGAEELTINNFCIFNIFVNVLVIKKIKWGGAE